MMVSIKGTMGLTRGRGFTELNRIVWLLSRPVVCKLDDKMREIAGIQLSESQSVVKAIRNSKIERDNQDVKILVQFFSESLCSINSSSLPCCKTSQLVLLHLPMLISTTPYLLEQRLQNL